MFAPYGKRLIRSMAVAAVAAMLIPSLGRAEDEVRLYQEPPSSTEMLFRLKGMKFRGAEAKATTYRAIKFTPPPEEATAPEPAQVAAPEPVIPAAPMVPVAPAAPVAMPPADPVQQVASAPPPAPVVAAPTSGRKGETLAFPAIFEAGKWDLTDEMRRYADVIGEVMQKDERLRLHISGHTDASGGDGVNVPLSRKRAQAVKEYLTSRYQIDPTRMIVSGYAARQPINPDDPLAQENRRVQIQPAL